MPFTDLCAHETKQNKKKATTLTKKKYDLTSHPGQNNLGFYLGRTAQQRLKRKKKKKKRHALFELCLEK